MRDKTLLRLNRRFDEVISLANNGFTSPQIYYQFLTNVTHYMRYIEEHDLTSKALTKLTEDQRHIKLDKDLIEQADEVILRMKSDIEKLKKAAKRLNVNIGVPDTGGTARRISNAELAGLHIGSADDFLNEAMQYVGDLSKYIGELRQGAFYLSREMQRPPKWLRDMTKSYDQVQNEIAIKLETSRVLSDYLRLDDYNELKRISNYVNNKSDNHEALMFLMDNYDLIDKSNTLMFTQADESRAKAKSQNYIGNLQRLHNYLIDELENPDLKERIWIWFKEHLLPTFISLIIVLIIYLILNYILKIPVDIKSIKEFTT